MCIGPFANNQQLQNVPLARPFVQGFGALGVGPGRQGAPGQTSQQAPAPQQQTQGGSLIGGTSGGSRRNRFSQSPSLLAGGVDRGAGR